MRHVVTLTIAAAITLGFAAEGHPHLKVAATIFPLADIAGEVGADSVSVTTIVPRGSDPHHFELTPHSALAIHEADLIFMIGGHFDQWVVRGQSSGAGSPIRIEFHKLFGDSLIPIGHSFNPHFWLDPLYARAMAEVIKMALCTLDVAGCDYYESRLRIYNARLDSLDASTRRRLGKAGITKFVGFHPAWSYFARRYGLTEIGTIEASHEQEPSARHIADMVRRMKADNALYIFVEEFSNPDLVEGIVSQTGARVVVLDPLGAEGRPGRDSYLRLIDHNVSVIEKATSPEPHR
jgi:zinc transport system substrate-binding protein